MTTREATPGPAEPATIDALLEHAPFLRRLARGLVSDEARADDLVQDTWLAALRRPPRDAADARGWLAAVARRLSIDGRKTDARRAAREVTSARSEVRPPADEIEEHVELAQVLLVAVRSLSEPYRQAIWLRYYEELPLRSIARRLELPVRTVETHLRRGKQELRARLDAKQGGRDAWLPAMAGLATSRGPGALALASGTSPSVLAAGLLTLSLVAAGIWLATASRSEATVDPESSSVPTRLARVAGPTTPIPPTLLLDAGKPVRSPVTVSEITKTLLSRDGASPGDGSSSVLEGSVRWEGLAPAGEVQVGLIRTVGGSPSGRFIALTTCAAGETFTLEVPGGGKVLLVAVAEGAPVSTSALELPDSGRAKVEVLESDPGIRLAGAMTDPEGELLRGARLTARHRGTGHLGLIAGAVIREPTRIEFDFGTTTSEAGTFRESTYPLGDFELRYVDGAFRRVTEQAICDGQGRFRFVGLGAGEHTVDAVPRRTADLSSPTVLSLRRSRRPLVAEAPDEHLELEWRETRLRFLVRDEEGPLAWVIAAYGPYADLEQSASSTAAPDASRHAITFGSRGELTLFFDPADDLGFHFKREGHAPVLLRLANAVPDARGVVTISMPMTASPASLYVRLDCGAAEPPERMRAMLKSHRSPGPEAATGMLVLEVPLIAGEVRFEDLPPGEYSLELSPRGGAPLLDMRREVVIERGITTLEATLELGGAIEVVLGDCEIDNTASSFLIRGSDGRHQAVSWDRRSSPADDPVRLHPALAPGEWTLIARHRGVDYWEAPLKLVAGEVTRIAVPPPPQ